MSKRQALDLEVEVALGDAPLHGTSDEAPMRVTNNKDRVFHRRLSTTGHRVARVHNLRENGAEVRRRGNTSRIGRTSVALNEVTGPLKYQRPEFVEQHWRHGVLG